MSKSVKIEILENRTFLSASPFPASRIENQPALWSVNTNGGDLKKLMGGDYRLFREGNELYLYGSSNLWKIDAATGNRVKVAGDGYAVVTSVVTAKGFLYYSLLKYNDAEGGVYGNAYSIDSSGQTRTVSPYGSVGVFLHDGYAYARVTTYHSANHPSLSTQVYALSQGAPTLKSTDPIVEDPLPPDTATVSQGKFYAFDDGTHGSELWLDRSFGASLVQDIFPGDSSSAPHSLTVLNDRVYFIATTPTITNESAGILDGTLSIQGTEWDDSISVASQGGSTTVTLSYTRNGTLHEETATFDDADFTDIAVHAGEGNDQIHVNGTNKPVTVFGEAGNDRIYLDATVTANTTLDGGEGDDTLTGGGGNDVLTGGNGSDTADYSMESVNLDSSGLSTLMSPDRGNDLLNVESLLSGSGDDHLSFKMLKTGQDTLRYIDAGAGDDSVGITSINPTVHGGDGNDNLYIAGGTTGTYFGDVGDDILRFGRSTNTKRDFHGGDGIDTVDYTSNNFPGSIKVTIDDQPGDGPDGWESVASLGDNVHTDVEIVRGSYGNDTIIGSANDETLIGGGGNDCLVGNGGSDSLDGGDGNNTILDFLPLSPPPPPPAPPITTPAASPTLTNHILQVNGTTGNDRITLRHKVGDASILQVVLNGKISNFTFSDVQKINVTASNGNDFVDLRDIAIGATILGGNGNDSIYGSNGADSIDGGRGDDYLCGMAGNDSITGGIGHDLIRGGDGVDRLFANASIDDLNKNKGDTIVKDLLG